MFFYFITLIYLFYTTCKSFFNRKGKVAAERDISAKKYFKIISQKESECQLCHKIYKHSGNGTNLQTHLLSQHQNLVPELIAKVGKRKHEKNTASETITKKTKIESKPVKKVYMIFYLYSVLRTVYDTVYFLFI